MRLLAALSGFAAATTVMANAANEAPVLLFGKAGSQYHKWWYWKGISDVVMGGKSTAEFDTANDPDLARFHGEISKENGGGFASCRFDDMNKEIFGRVLSAAAAGCDAIAVTAVPSGPVFKIVLRTDDVPYGVYYTGRFDTGVSGLQPAADGTVRFIVPLGAFEPRIQGQRWGEGPAIAGFHTVRSFGFMVGDGQEGPFELSVASMEGTRVAVEGVQGGAPRSEHPSSPAVQSSLLQDGAAVLTHIPADCPTKPRPPKQGAAQGASSATDEDEDEL